MESAGFEAPHGKTETRRDDPGRSLLTRVRLRRAAVVLDDQRGRCSSLEQRKRVEPRRVGNILAPRHDVLLDEPLPAKRRRPTLLSRLARNLDVKCQAIGTVGNQIVALADAPTVGYTTSRVGYRALLTYPVSSVFVAWDPQAAERWLPDDPAARAAALASLDRVCERRWSVALGDAWYDELERAVGRQLIDSAQEAAVRRAIGGARRQQLRPRARRRRLLRRANADRTGLRCPRSRPRAVSARVQAAAVRVRDRRGRRPAPRRCRRRQPKDRRRDLYGSDCLAAPPGLDSGTVPDGSPFRRPCSHPTKRQSPPSGALPAS